VQRGDVLLALNGKPVQGIEQVRDALRAHPKHVALLVAARRAADLRAGQPRLISAGAQALASAAFIATASGVVGRPISVPS
jgi:S1-C subfamily serine protease